MVEWSLEIWYRNSKIYSLEMWFLYKLFVICSLKRIKRFLNCPWIMFLYSFIWWCRGDTQIVEAPSLIKTINFSIKILSRHKMNFKYISILHTQHLQHLQKIRFLFVIFFLYFCKYIENFSNETFKSVIIWTPSILQKTAQGYMSFDW